MRVWGGAGSEDGGFKKILAWLRAWGNAGLGNAGLEAEGLG